MVSAQTVPANDPKAVLMNKTEVRVKRKLGIATLKTSNHTENYTSLYPVDWKQELNRR